MSVSFLVALALTVCTSQASTEWEDIDFRQRYQPRLRRQNSDNDLDYIPPSKQELREAFKNVAGWYPERPGYNATFTLKIHNSQTVTNRIVQHQIDVKDPNFPHCNSSSFFVECAECKGCEREFAAFDSCGIMTARFCIVVTLIKTKYEETCKRLKKESDHPKCLEFVEEEVDTESNNKCTDYNCQPISVEKCDTLFGTTEFIVNEYKKECSRGKFGTDTCAHRYEDPNPDTKDTKYYEIVKKCAAGCDAEVNKTCTLEDPIRKECHSIEIESNPQYSFCREQVENECGDWECQDKLQLGKNLTVLNGVVKCKDDCMVPKVTKHDLSKHCAEEIVCVKTCQEAEKCPHKDEPWCMSHAVETITDKCGCAQSVCGPKEGFCDFVPPKCHPGQRPLKCPDTAKCCPQEVYPDATHTSCVCETGSGPLCCLGDGCDLPNCQRDEDNKHDFKKCCPRDENGCLKLGSICIISSPHNGTKDYVVFHDDKAKCDSSFCPHPHASVKPNPMCCVGDHCNKTKCETLQNCCTNGGCCKMHNSEEGEWQLVGSKCTEECSATNDLCEDCYTIDKNGSAAVCPEGKCCCHDNFKLVAKDCPPKCPNPPCIGSTTLPIGSTTPPIGSTTTPIGSTTSGPIIPPETTPSVTTGVTFTTSSGVVITTTLGPTTSYKTESTSPHGSSTTEGTRGPTSTTEGSTSTMIGQTTPKPTWPTQPTGQTTTWTHGTGSSTLTTGSTSGPGSTSSVHTTTRSYVPSTTTTEGTGCNKDWTASNDNPNNPNNRKNCQRYIDEQWCTKDGGKGPNWRWGDFEKYADAEGNTALVCPQCGCGRRSTSGPGSTSSIHTTTRSYVPSTTTTEGIITSGPSVGTTSQGGTAITSGPSGATTKGVTTKGPGGTTTTGSFTIPPPCEKLEDPYTELECCWGESCCVGNGEGPSKCCPEGKACCEKQGKIHVVGTHCCKGDGCCALGNGRKNCCLDPGSCCGTGCFKHCRVTQADGKKDGFYDHFAKGVVGESQCDCRPDVAANVCKENVQKRGEQKKCYALEPEVCFKYTETKCITTETSETEAKCETTTTKCERKVCKPQNSCPSPLSNFLRAIRLARSP